MAIRIIMLSTIMYLASLFSIIVFVFAWGVISGIKIGLDWDTISLLNIKARLGVVLLMSALGTIAFFVIGTVIK